MSVFSPTSRGAISISSASATDPPAIAPNHNTTEVDRTLMRLGIRRVSKMVKMSLSDIIDDESPPPGLPILTSDSSDSDIDTRVTSQWSTFLHAGDSASMGKVVDTAFRVKGVHGLSVMDASIISIPIASHYQPPVHALALRSCRGHC